MITTLRRRQRPRPCSCPVRKHPQVVSSRLDGAKLQAWQRGENRTFLLPDPQAATLQRRGPNFMCQMLAVFSTTKLNSLVDYKRLWKASRKTPCFGIAPFPPRALICKFLKEGKPEKLRMVLEYSTKETLVRQNPTGFFLTTFANCGLPRGFFFQYRADMTKPHDSTQLIPFQATFKYTYKSEK